MKILQTLNCKLTITYSWTWWYPICIFWTKHRYMVQWRYTTTVKNNSIQSFWMPIHSLQSWYNNLKKHTNCIKPTECLSLRNCEYVAMSYIVILRKNIGDPLQQNYGTTGKQIDLGFVWRATERNDRNRWVHINVREVTLWFKMVDKAEIENIFKIHT